MFVLIPLELKQAKKDPAAPVVNLLLIALNVLLFACGVYWPVGPGMGVLSILMYGFCHCGFWHLLVNMWALWVFGNPVNRRLGNGYYLMAYLGAVLVLGLLARIFLRVYLVGSSGGLFAVIAVALLLMPVARLEVGYLAVFPITLIVGLLKRPKHWFYWFIRVGIFRIPAFWCLVLVPLLELWSFCWWSYYSSAWSWGHAAHLFGMVCGLAIVLMLPTRITMRRRATAADF